MEESYYRPTREDRKETTLGIRSAVGIRRGVQCTNNVQDQQHIIFLLNRIPASNGGTLHPTGPTTFKAPRQGHCDPSLSELIRKFQLHHGLAADGVVDPDGPTLKALTHPPANKGNSQKPTPARPVLTPPQMTALHQLIDTSHRLLGDSQFMASAGSLGIHMANTVREIESELQKLGITLPRTPAPPVQRNTADIGVLPKGLAIPIPMRRPADIVILDVLIEFLLIAFAVVILMGALVLLLRKLLKTVRDILVILCKSALSVLRQIDATVTDAVRAGRHRCREDSYRAYIRASNAFKDALEAGFSSRAVMRPAARAFWNSLRAMLECLEAGAASIILGLLGIGIFSSTTFIGWVMSLL